MRVEVLLPSMGESVTEATVTNWLKSVGEMVEEDENLVEVATDKVDTEVPSPVSGKIVEIISNVDDVAQVDGMICIIETSTGSVSESVSTPKIKKDENQQMLETTEPTVQKIAVVLPSMGESVTEATVTNWLKSVGEMVEEDENLVEVATDKVDTEVPSPISGKIVEIVVDVDGIAQVDGVICYIEAMSSGSASTSSAPEEKISVKKSETINTVDTNSVATGTNSGFFTPLVKKMALVEKISTNELSNVNGTGRNGRVTKTDMESYLNNRGSAPKPNGKLVSGVTAVEGNFPHKIAPVNISYDESRVTVEKMSTMRKGIAKHMIQSIYTAPHVFSIHEVNMKSIWDWRNKIKGAFKNKYGFNLTFTHIIMEAVAKAVRSNPKINSSIQGDTIIIRHDINLGMAVGYTAKGGDNGLIVPVIKNADELTLVGIARKSAEITGKARDGKIKPDDTAGGTFTVTNVGSFGTEVGLGIINQPQVAILSLGAIIRKPVITKDDAIMVAPMMKVALCYDHRVVDGMLAGNFLQMLQTSLENFVGDDSII
jgi:2-oxoglutarate dehydrogenase E2 component (dihydrolipoamide succinyltransferase)